MNTTVAPDTTAPSVSTQPGARPVHRWPKLWARRTWMLMGLALLLVVYRMSVIQFSGMSLFFDEAQYWDWSQHLQWGYYSKPPVIAGLVRLSTTLFGDSVLGVKAVSMLLYAATALSIVGLARALWPTTSGVRTGVVAGAIFLTSPMVGMLGMFASTDAPLLLCWTLAAWALWRAQVTNRLWLWALCGLFVGLGVLSKYTMVAFGITAIWALWGVQGPRRGLVRVGPWLALAVALLVVSPNIVWNAQEGFPTLRHTTQITTGSDRSGGPVEALSFFLGQLLMIGPLAVIGGLLLQRSLARQPKPDLASASQWASSSQVIPPSQWASSTQQASTLQASTFTPPGGKSRTTRTSAYYLASVTAYRYLIMLSMPLLLVALVQAFVAGAHLNWAAPAMVGLMLLIASRLSQPLIPLSAPRPRAWFWIILTSNLLLTGLVIHARDIMGERLPEHGDALVRMRGWDQAFSALEGTLADPRYQGLPVVAENRLMLTQASYHWRKQKPRIMAWNPKASRDNHYQLQQSMANTVGQDVLILSDTENPKAMLSRFAWTKELGRSAVQVGAKRQVRLYLYLGRGFVGYDNETYKFQSGTEGSTTEDTPFTEQKTEPKK
jgi:4-amino-4-deoxy-L-arabinose transferase-like glycosyltransferase